MLSLRAPDGHVFSNVLFASYGHPTGSDGLFTVGYCHSQSSVEQIAKVAYGKTKFGIKASNEVFGDVSHNRVKKLAVVLETKV